MGKTIILSMPGSEIQQEKILQLSFQLVRTSDPTRRYNLANKFKECFQKWKY